MDKIIKVKAISKQVLVIHGGGTFETYEEYIVFLKTKEVTLERLLRKDWKNSLQGDLGDTYQVIAPQMPNSQNARYLEWKIRFERIIPLLNDTIILIGHSLGAIFLIKYLSENTLSKNIEALFLIAAPYKDEPGESLVDFNTNYDFTQLLNQSKKIVLYHSKDDPVVPYVHAEFYHEKMPTAILRTFENRQHFNQPQFPELIEDIKNLK